MASDEGFATPQESDRSALREKWEAEFSRFFIFPIQCFSNATALRPRRSKSNVRNGSGAWLTARSPATILILRADPAAMAVLSICVSGYIHEEHLVATLNFSWPQVACVPQCPIRGSKVVLASYMDCSHQVQKFAMRFPTFEVAETFFQFVKDCSRNVMDIVPAASDFLYDNSSPSEMIASNALELKLDEGQSHEEITQREMMSPPLGGDQSSSDRPLSALLTRNINTITGLPCSFTELLTNCTKIPNKESSIHLEEANHAHVKREYMLNPSQTVAEQSVILETDIRLQIARYMSDASFHDVTEESIMSEKDIMLQIARYMSDASFHEMLFTIEKVIHEMGGDLSL